MWKCGNAKLRKYGNAKMRKCKNAEMQKCGNAKMRKCKNAEMQKCGNTKSVLQLRFTLYKFNCTSSNFK